MPILEFVHVVYALAHGNVAAIVGRSPPPWRELGTASLFTASSPMALSLRLGEHRLAIGGREGLVWPTWRPYVSVAASVYAWVPRGLGRGKGGKGEGDICKIAD